MKDFIVISGSYPYKYWGPFTEEEADNWVKELCSRPVIDACGKAFAIKVQLQPTDLQN